jgi:hypothetical protein
LKKAGYSRGQTGPPRGAVFVSRDPAAKKLFLFPNTGMVPKGKIFLVPRGERWGNNAHRPHFRKLVAPDPMKKHELFSPGCGKVLLGFSSFPTRGACLLVALSASI